MSVILILYSSVTLSFVTRSKLVCCIYFMKMECIMHATEYSTDKKQKGCKYYENSQFSPAQVYKSARMTLWV